MTVIGIHFNSLSLGPVFAQSLCHWQCDADACCRCLLPTMPVADACCQCLQPTPIPMREKSDFSRQNRTFEGRNFLSRVTQPRSDHARRSSDARRSRGARCCSEGVVSSTPMLFADANAVTPMLDDADADFSREKSDSPRRNFCGLIHATSRPRGGDNDEIRLLLDADAF